MDSLSDTTWDVVISGTGIRQSLLALALSRSGKKILHVDHHNYYGGPEAAFSLHDASEWLSDWQKKPLYSSSTIEPISLWTKTNSDKLRASRSYTLTLSPHVIYSRSALLPALVSSRLHAQLEFQAIGSWWILKDNPAGEPRGDGEDKTSVDTGSTLRDNNAPIKFSLQKIPSTREDVFADDDLPPREKRSLMKFLRSVVVEPNVTSEVTEDVPLPSLFMSLDRMAPTLQRPLLALSLSYDSPGSVKTTAVFQRIRRHVRSIGAFGPGFGAVMPKYGGGAEIAQVACRASAVGGAVYVLGRGLMSLHDLNENSCDSLVSMELSDGERIQAQFVVGSENDLPTDLSDGLASNSHTDLLKTVQSISIVSSPLDHLFPPTSESGPTPAGAVVVYYCNEDETSCQNGSISAKAPVYMLIHSSESGECPPGQCVVYSSTISQSKDDAEDVQRLGSAMAHLLQASAIQDSSPEILWSLKYRAKGRSIDDGPGQVQCKMNGRVIIFPRPSMDPVFDDSILEEVKEVWKRIMGAAVEESDFLKFEEARGLDTDDEF